MKFEDWFNETENFGLRSERFYDDLLSYKWDGVDAEFFAKWLKAAYEEGYNQSRYDTMKLYWDDGK